MMKLINKAARRLGIPGRPAIILGPNEAVELTQAQIVELRKNRTVMKWVERGALKLLGDGEVDDTAALLAIPASPTPKRAARSRPRQQVDVRQEPILPEGVVGDGVEIYHVGGGWYQVFVNGVKATDRNVRKDEATVIAKDYE